jgi:serine/threonine-protein kinase HipA
VTGHELRVTLPAREVGVLRQRRGGLVQWTPDAEWERDGQLPRLGLDFLRDPGSRSASSELPTWFENLLPEPGSALRVRLCDHFEIREGASFPLLELLGHDLPGAVEVHGGPTGTEPKDETVAAMKPTETDSHQRVDPENRRSFSALAGMQLKFSMSMENQRLSLPARSSAGSWIVKLPGREYDELAEVETATMTWAAKAGFSVPEHRTVPFDQLVGLPDWAERSAPVFAIARFDRRPDGTRVHHEDLCQALGLRPMHKTGDSRPGVRFEGALRLIVDACGQEDGRDMARRLGFMIASGNGDAHLKNWGLLWGDRSRPCLAPCYDLVATIAWERFGWETRGGPKLALRLGTARRFADLSRALLDGFSKSSGQTWATDELLAGIAAARDAWRHVDVPKPARLQRALTTHWSRVPVLREVGPLSG